MQDKIYTIFDTKLEIFYSPFVMRTDEAAIRAFADIVNRGESDISNHPEDFTLFQIGDWDKETAKITMLEAMHSLTNGMYLKNKDDESAMEHLVA